MGYRSHVLTNSKWMICHNNARQGAFPPQANWRQAPTQAYHMTAKPRPEADLMSTICAAAKRHQPGWTTAPSLVSSPHQGAHLRATWGGEAVRTNDVPELHAGPITQAQPAAILALAQRKEQNESVSSACSARLMRT